MPISIRIISAPENEEGIQWETVFPETGGVIGRGHAAKLRLFDKTNEISNNHAILHQMPNGYQIEDNSLNGLFINGETKALGKGNKTTINDGDILTIGRYNLLVSCFTPANSKMAKEDKMSSEMFFSDDPFRMIGNEEKKIEIKKKEIKKQKRKINSTETMIIDDDPFLVDEMVKKEPIKQLNVLFSNEDDDLLTQFQNDSFSLEPHQTKNTASIEYDSLDLSSIDHRKTNKRIRKKNKNKNKNKTALSQLTSFDDIHPLPKKNAFPIFTNHASNVFTINGQLIDEEFIDKAIDIAFSKLLADISPHSVEPMFDEMNKSIFRKNKSKYWEMYKSYFSRHMSNHDWNLRFRNYFYEVIRYQKRKEGA